MKIKSISFENYKAFSEKQTLEIKPITVLIGKNSSGKSSIAKLFALLENSLSGKIDEPLLVKNNGVELGAEFIDLVFGQSPSPVHFSIEFEDKTLLSISVLQDGLKYDLDIKEWAYKDEKGREISLTYSPREDIYTDSVGKKYQCEFKGFIPVKIENKVEGNIVPFDVTNFSIDVDYIGPFRILPKRQFYLTGQLDYYDTGIQGENAYSMLGSSKLMKTDLHEKVGSWYKDHFDGWELKVEDKNRPYIQILLSKDDTNVNIVDVGQGMNQALPLVVRANINRSNSIIVVEQPELHLHPAAHGDIAELFALSAKTYNQNFIIETHSENFLLRLRKLIIDNDFGLTKDDVLIYWSENAENSGQELRKITIDEEGVLSDWPEGVFNESVKEILEMQKALNQKKQK
jgi:predicted ATPase